jgi:hypothetical protein
MAINTPEMSPEAIQPTSDMVVLDIGKRDADAVRKLRKGKGKLLRKVNHAVEQLRDAGKIKKDAQIVMIVVREKNTSLFGDDSDDDDD